MVGTMLQPYNDLSGDLLRGAPWTSIHSSQKQAREWAAYLRRENPSWSVTTTQRAIKVASQALTVHCVVGKPKDRAAHMLRHLMSMRTDSPAAWLGTWRVENTANNTWVVTKTHLKGHGAVALTITNTSGLLRFSQMLAGGELKDAAGLAAFEAGA